jgi:hypothetical protein
MKVKFEIADSKNLEESDEEEEGETVKICKFSKVSGSSMAYSKFIKEIMQSEYFNICVNAKL